ncbi:BnaC09g12350D [Brassica napus]|uniref:BnaC09g12350D protein n=1 Tax=Brassica napus TaxID=3708 RepID=A0A078F4L6_BRANA|nr:BnaC09g12350D [Brassica napus]
MHARFQNTGFASKSSPNSFKILGRSLQVQESEAAADTTLRLDSLSSPLSNSIGTKRKWMDQEADPLLSLRLGHSSSSSDSKGSSATAFTSLSSAKEIEEASSMDIELDFTLHLGNEKPATNHKPANLKMKELQVLSPEFDLELSGSSQSEITAVQQQANQFPTLGDMLRATNEGSTSRGWRPGFASSPALQALSSKETSSFLAHAPKKIIIPAPRVLDLSSSSATTTTTTPISSGTCTSVLSQQLKPQHKSSSSSKLCQVEGCQKGARGASGRCISHGGGRRCQRHGCHKGAEGRTVYCKAHGGGRRCEFLGCTKSAEGRTDFCIAHGGGRRCSHEDCTRAARGRSGLCIRHGGGKRCQRENCTKSAEGLSGLCISHGGGRRCQSSGCTKGAQGSTMFCKAHGGGKRCTHPGCTKGAEGSTPFCKGHGGGKRCAFQEGHPCSKSVHGGTNFCVAHGGGKRCTVEGRDASLKDVGKARKAVLTFARRMEEGSVVLGVIPRLSMRDNRVHGGMTVTSESQDPRVSSSEEEFSGSQDMNMDRMKARSAVGSPETDIDLNENETGSGLAPEGRVHGGSLIMAMLAAREGGSGSSNLPKRWV